MPPFPSRLFTIMTLWSLAGASAWATPADTWRGKVIYFALVDRFSNGDPGNDRAHGDAVCNNPADPHAFQGGDLAGLTNRLTYIKDLGATALWISPLYRGVPVKQGANCGFPGYWADFDVPYTLALDPRYGNANDFEKLITQSHRFGMPVMLDMVVNHAGYQAKALRQRPDWFADPATCHSLGDPAIFCPLAGLPDFLHQRRDVQDYLIDIHRQWLRRFPIDAIRMDTVKHVEPWYFNLWNQHMRAERNDVYILGELLDEYSFHQFPRYLDSGFDGLFNFPLRSALIRSFAHGGSIDDAAHLMSETLSKFGPDRADLMVNLLDNHDVRRFLEEMPPGISAEAVMKRYELALTALLTLPGIPQIYYGNELGMYGGSDPHNRRFMPEWAFDASSRNRAHPGFVASPQRIHKHVRHLLQLRQRNDALRVGRYYELWRQNGSHNPNVWAFLKHDPSSQRHAIVAFNNGERALDGPLPIATRGFLRDGTVLESQMGSTQSVVVASGTIKLWLPAKSATIFFVRGE